MRFLALVALFVVLSLAYNVALPVYEAPDERDHISYAAWLADGRGLPHLVADRDVVGEIWQPPLFYALTALALAPFDRAELATIAPLSGDWQAGLSQAAHYHSADEAFPFRGAALAIHTARLVSTLLSLVTVAATYAIARLIAPALALPAAALLALNPQFIFLSAAINNDNLVIALCSVALWILVRLIVAPYDGREPLAWYALLGIVWGLAALAKLTGLTLGLPIGLSLLYLAWRRRSWRPLLLGGLLSGGTMLLVCGWWFGRNWQLYGDPLAWNEMLAVTAGLVRPELLSWPETLRYAGFLRQSYWGVFGYGVRAPDGFYTLVMMIMLLAAAGWGVWLARRPRPWRVSGGFALLLLAVWSLTVFVFLLRWMRQIDTTNQGRLLFPAIAALSVLAAVGLAAFDGRRRWATTAAVVALGCWAAAMPLLVIAPAYAAPPAAGPEAVVNPLDIRFGETIRLLGYDLPATAAPGQPMTATLYWQADAPPDESYVLALRLLDPTGRPVSAIDTLPAAGRYSTLVWEPGRPFRDSYVLPPVAGDATPGLGTLLIVVYPRGLPDAPLPVTAGGQAAGHEVRLGAIKIVPAAPVVLQPPRATGVTFGDRFRLLGHDAPAAGQPGQTLPLTLAWQALSPDGRDYTAFVHLVDSAGELVAQSDGPPQGGAYPTSIWAAGEQVADARALPLPADLPPGEYALLVGLYDPASEARLPAADAAGGRVPDDAVELARLVIGSPQE